MQGYYAGVTHVDKQACCACAVHALCICRVHVPCMRRACGVHAGRDAALPVRVGGPAAAGGACVGGPVGEDDRAPHVGPRVEAGRARRVEQAHALRGGHARATHRAPSHCRRPRRGGRGVTTRRGGAGRGGADRCDAQPARAGGDQAARAAACCKVPPGRCRSSLPRPRVLASRGGLSRLPAALRTRHEQLLRRSGPEGRAAVRP